MTTENEAPVDTLYSKFGTSKDAESGAGVDLDYGKMGKFRIHRAGGSNARYKNFAQAKMKPYNRQIQAGTMDDDVATKLMVEIFAKTVIVGWAGVKDRDGKDLPFSVDNAIQLFTDLPDLFSDIRAAALDHQTFMAEEKEIAVKN